MAKEGAIAYCISGNGYPQALATEYTCTDFSMGSGDGSEDLIFVFTLQRGISRKQLKSGRWRPLTSPQAFLLLKNDLELNKPFSFIISRI